MINRLLPTCLFIVAALCAHQSTAQTFQLLFETFDNPSSVFDLNAPGPTGANSGSNNWIINDEYNGGGIYPNTVPQDSTFFGTINDAPDSRYLHIHDSLTTTVANANFDPSIPSDRFAMLSADYCTLGLTDVTFSFFYTCDGGADDYGEVWYQADGGPWTQVGMAKYNNREQWQFESITDPAFDDVESLNFGFRWVNDGAGATSTSFSVDDVVLVATYDEILNPVTIEITSVSPDPVCQVDNLLIFWELSDPLCEGQYEIELSAPGGGYVGLTTGLGVFTIAENDTTGAIFTLPVPSTTLPDPCYTVRINRLSPLPAITGEASICFEVEDCPNTITTLQPVVTFDTNAVCINSVMDVPFFSTGAFIAGNVYTAQLSDSTGSFASPETIGTLSTSATFDPTLGSPPGTVSGIVPTVPPGCGYFIRVVSSIPGTTGSVWGPFCIQECDIETNEVEDIFVCITEDDGVTVEVPLDINVFDSLALYCDTNSFEIEILDPMFFTQVSLGDLGITISDSDTSVLMDVPGYFDLLALGLDAGVWYMRINADCSSDDENSLGTLIHLTIGAPADEAPLLIPTDSLVCEGGLASFLVSPYNINSRYQFQFLPGGTPFFWSFNPILVNLDGFVGELAIHVREINYGCPGPWSDTATIDVIDEPIVAIEFDDPICTGDTIQLSVPFFTETFYEWDADGGTIVDTSNNVIQMIFDTAGIYNVEIFGLNQCGSGTGSSDIEVVATNEVDLGEDPTICVGQSISLDGATTGVFFYNWYAADTLAFDNIVFNVSPDSTETFILDGINADGCVGTDSITVFVDYPSAEFALDSICPGAILELDGGYPDADYNWTGGVTGGGQFVDVNAPGLYTAVINDPNVTCPITKEFDVFQIIDICEALLFVPNAFSPNGDGQNDYFTIFGQAIQDYDLQIFNRWGELVYQSNDLGDVSSGSGGWDGTFNGEPQNVGTYVYTVTAVGGDGVEVSKRGEIFLIR